MATQQLTASGDALDFSLHASITNNRVRFLTGHGTAQSSGSAAVLRKLPVGGLTDFGLWSAAQPDSAMSRDMSHSSGSDSTNTKSWLTTSVPTTYAPAGRLLWNQAAYAGIGIKWTGLATGERHAFDNVQLEKAPSGNRLSWNATSWEGRRCYTSQSTVNYSNVSTSSDKALSGKNSGMIVYTGAPAGQWGYWINPTSPNGMAPCIAGEIISGSVSVNMQRAAWWSAGLQFYDATFTQLGSWNFSAYQQHPGGGKWDTSYVYSMTVPSTAVWVAVVPHISVNSTPAATDSIAPIGETAYCDMHRIWARPYSLSGTPTAYTTPRKLSISVKANRVNLINNPGLDADLWGWGFTPHGTIPNPLVWDGTTGRTKTGSLKFTIPPNPGSFGLPTTLGTALLTAWSTSQVGGYGWATSATYTSSLYVRLGPGCPAVTLVPGGYTATAGVLSTDDALAHHPELVDGDWIRLWGTFTTGDSDDGLVGLRAVVNSADIPAQGASFWVDDAMSEIGDQPLPYFDGGSKGADYLWAGTPGRSSSHYYRGFRSSAYRLKDIVQSAVPHGTQFTLLYAQPPT